MKPLEKLAFLIIVDEIKDLVDSLEKSRKPNEIFNVRRLLEMRLESLDYFTEIKERSEDE